MDRISLGAEEREVLGKKVKHLRKDGKLPGHIFGKGVESENVLVSKMEFLKTFKTAGETGVINLKVGAEKVRPVMVRGIQYDPISNEPIHIDFYQVNLSQKVKVPVPLVLVGEDPEVVKLGEAIVLQTISELEVEALPNDLVENIEVNIAALKAIDDAITVGQLSFDREKLTITADPEEIVVKLAPAVSAEMEALLEEQAAEQAAAAAETEGAEGEPSAESEQAAEGAEATKEEVTSGEGATGDSAREESAKEGAE